MLVFNRLKSIFIFVIILGFDNLLGDNIYVDNTLSGNITNGTYSITNRNNSGSDGNAYTTVQAAINVVTTGDIIYMRGGTYNENIVIPSNKKGTVSNPIVWRSYPGEWAIIDGGGNGGAVIYNAGGGMSFATCPDYWIIRNFEITGGSAGTASQEYGGGINLDTVHHLTFMYLYIHDNGAGSGWNDGGLVIQNDTQTAQYVTVKYCWLENTTCSNSGNCATVGLFSDYDGANLPININNARHHNEIAYNRVIGGVQGIRSKSWQVLTNDHSGGNMPYAYQDYGDKIHHNIVEDFIGAGIELRQDFIQCYNNILKIDVTTTLDELFGCILVGCQEYNTDREPFHAVVYNNLCIGSDICIEHQTNGIYNPPIHPYSHIYNNIIENPTIHMESRIPFSICSNSTNTFSDIDMTTIWFDNNLFVPFNRTTNVIRIEDINRTINQYVSDGYSTTVYNATSTSGLHKTGSEYKCNANFVLNGSTTIGNGGVGMAHPYLNGVTIPPYIGAANPDDDAWVDGVLAMDVAWFTDQTGDEDPPWIDGNNYVLPLSADFTGTPTSGSSPLIVNFSDESRAGEGTINSWSWDFGDSGTSSQQNPTHTYNSNGTYTVSLTVGDDLGGSDTLTRTNYITVGILGSVPHKPIINPIEEVE